VQNERIQDPVSREISDAGASVRQGLTADLELSLGSRLSAFLVGTVNDARISGATNPTPQVVRLSAVRPGTSPVLPTLHLEPLEPGDPVPSVSRWTGRVGIDTRVGGVQGRALWRFSGPFTPIGEPDVKTQSYGVLDLNAAIPVTGALSAYVDLVNVFDTKYPEVRASGFLNPGMLRTLRVALRIGDAPTSSHH
jgi:outer membrane receptor protein involved in Fe transport